MKACLEIWQRAESSTPSIPAALVWGWQTPRTCWAQTQDFPPCISRPSPTKVLLASPGHPALPRALFPRSSLTCLQGSPLWEGLSLFLALLLFFLRCFSFLRLFLFPLSNVFSTGITLGKGAEKVLNTYITSKTVISVGIASTRGFLTRFLRLAFFACLSGGQGEWVCGTPEDTAEILLLALELPGPAAGRALSPGREGRSAAGRWAELGVLPLPSHPMDLPRPLHPSLPFFTSGDAPAANPPYGALCLPWKAFSPSQRSLMCTPRLSHSLQGMPRGNNPQAQIQGPCINHIPTGASFQKLSI